ncbi:MAG: LysR family transcriptional regulator [Deltaproteobacteria bacterium]|nr:LysR family transcriptional regulator [Deltaproteobacteria bacterium]
MNLKQLEVFLAVVEHGSFSAGARESYVTQSTVSQHVAALEEELGVRLLERSRNGIALTEAGKILKRHARQVLGDIQAAHEAIRRFRGIEKATLRVAASTIPGGYLIPAVLVTMCERFPDLSVALLQGDSRDTIDRVASQEAELGVVGNRFEERGLTYVPVGNDEICLVVSRGHAWADRASVALADFPGAPFVVREPGSGTAKTVAEALTAAGVNTGGLRIRAHMGSNEAVKAAVMAGLGLSFLSEAAVRREVERGDLSIVPVEGLRISRRFHLVRRTGRELSPAATAFWDLMVITYG